MDTIAMLAHFYARTGQADKAREFSAAALAGAPDEMYVQYYSALVNAHLGDTDKALDRLKRAIELDYQKELLRLDPALASLREDDRFKQLVSKTSP
jgi:tetratricopeptide (TPR) repeat protein